MNNPYQSLPFWEFANSLDVNYFNPTLLPNFSHIFHLNHANEDSLKTMILMISCI